MSDLRRLIARMDQLNEADPRNSRGLDMPPLEGGSTGAGGAGGAAPSVKSGPFGTTIYTSPPPRVTASPRVNVDPNIAEIPAYQRAGKAEPEIISKSAADVSAKMDRLKAAQELSAKMDKLQAQQGKPKVDIKDVQRQRELQKQISGDPRPAVWKDPRNPSAPASKSPPLANVEPPAPLPYNPPTPATSLGGRSFRDASAEVNNGPSTLSKIGDTIKGQAMPWRGDAPPPSVYGPGGIKNFRRDATLNPDSIEYPVGKNAAETQAINLQKAADQAAYDKSLETPYFNPGLKTLAATTAAAALGPYNKPDPNNPSPLDRYKGPGGNAQMAWDAYRAKQYDDAQKQKQQQPASDKDSATDTEQTKESLHDKLFKEFKTFVEKR